MCRRYVALKTANLVTYGSGRIFCKMKKIGFIGIGNMGGAILEAVAKKLPGDEIMVCDHNGDKTARASAKYGCIVSSANEIAENSEYLMMCVKPQAAASAFAEITDTLSARAKPPVIVSIMAGVSIEAVLAMARVKCPVIRIMPNVAASVGESMTLCATGSEVSDNELNEFLDFMSESGKIDIIPEKLIDASSALSGCGPAYVCMFVEALADGAVECGVPRKSAMEYALRTLIGTAKLIEETGKHPGLIKDEVTSPAGTTIEGVRALERGAFRSSVSEAVIAAYEKTLRLKK